MTGDELAERGTDKWIREHTCPICRQPIDKHFTIAFTPEELETWSGDHVTCTRTRGEVEVLIRGGQCECMIEIASADNEEGPNQCMAAAQWIVEWTDGERKKMCPPHAARAQMNFQAVAEPIE